MTNPEDFLLSSYSFNLPEERIAQHPSEKRGDSKLLVFNKKTGEITDSVFTDLITFLPKKCLLVANNSRVIPARIFGKRQSGGKVEFLLLTPLPLIKELRIEKEGEQWFQAEAEGLLRSSKHIKEHEQIIFSPVLSLRLIVRGEFGRCKVLLSWKGSLKDIFLQIGQLPLPPYIRRTEENSSSGAWGKDIDRYQTSYAKEEKIGSVAAPTAGLHFTSEIKEAIIQSGRQWAEATLYVGYGTFSPVRCEDIRNHPMHAEYVELSKETTDLIVQAKEEGTPIIAIGTTSARILEGVYLAKEQSKGIEKKRDSPQEEEKKKQPLLVPYTGWINIFLYPGEKFSIIDGLITNFHLPESSLLMLVSALAGREAILHAYEHAINKEYNFFSYGDAMIIG